MSVQQDLGPRMPPRVAVYGLAMEVLALSRLAVELASPGFDTDVPRALKQIERIRDLVAVKEPVVG